MKYTNTFVRKELEGYPDLQQDPVSRMLRTMFVEEAKFDEERVVAKTLGFLVAPMRQTISVILKCFDCLIAMPEAIKLALEAAEADDLLRSSTLENRNIYSSTDKNFYRALDARLR